MDAEDLEKSTSISNAQQQSNKIRRSSLKRILKFCRIGGVVLPLPKRRFKAERCSGKEAWNTRHTRDENPRVHAPVHGGPCGTPPATSRYDRRKINCRRATAGVGVNYENK